MGTRSRIGYKFSNGNIVSSYCQSDSYPKGLGKELLENFNDYDKVKSLVNMFPYIEGIYDGMIHFAFGRDLHWKTSTSVEDFLKVGEEYNYLFEDGKWYVFDGLDIKSKRLLEDELNKKES